MLLLLLCYCYCVCVCCSEALCDFEEQNGYRVDTVVVHDAEDEAIHPDALKPDPHHWGLTTTWSSGSRLCRCLHPVYELTHGIYCDEFAEYQTVDMAARVYSKSFVPSNGVGTGYARGVLDRLAAVTSNRIFDAGSLTEDYESGARIHQLGFKQVFAPSEQ